MKEKFESKFTDDNKVWKILNNLIASGITDEDEQVEILMRDYRHLIRQLTEQEKEQAKEEFLHLAIEKTMADLNRESLKENGHPFAACYRVGGVKHYKKYDALSGEEIAELRQRGIIP